MKRILVFAAALVCSLSAYSQTLRFNENGEFKIVQFTDLHYDSHKPESRIVLKRMYEVILAEDPDLVVVTGDMIYSNPAREALSEVLDGLARFGTPFCTVFGNHDEQLDMTKPDMYDLIRSYPNCQMPERGDSYSPDYTVPILSSDGSKVASVLYCIDSNMHLYDEAGTFIGYDSIHRDQVEWYCARSDAFTSANGGSPVPSLAFFHIPLPEYNLAASDESSFLVGTRMEVACSPSENTGLFSEMEKRGDVFGVFVGHDHDDDYAVLWKDILLAYGRYTGGNTEYNHLPNGARVIVLKEGRRALDSYIRLKGGEIESRISYPETFHHSNWRERPLDPECIID